jgi:hypothetical protein
VSFIRLLLINLMGEEESGLSGSAEGGFVGVGVDTLVLTSLA